MTTTTITQNQTPNWVDVSYLWDYPPHSDLTFVDLFCGAGGLSKGLEMAGWRGICGIDSSKEAGRTYRRNFSHAFILGDITKESVQERFYETVRENLRGNELDLVAGGFPCQGFSMAGKRRSDDPRNRLYEEMVKVVSTLKPRFVLCENVRGFRNMLGGEEEKKMIEAYRDIGYDISVMVLNAADYGVSQTRQRAIYIGHRIDGEDRVNLYPRPLFFPDNYKTVGDAIADLMDRPDNPAFNHVATKHTAEMTERIRKCPEGKSLYENYGDAWKRCKWDEPSCTVKENHGGVNLHPRLPRAMTVRELARLQSFPDDFIFEGPKSKQLVQVGNAVPCLLAKAVGLALREMNEEHWSRMIYHGAKAEPYMILVMMLSTAEDWGWKVDKKTETLLKRFSRAFKDQDLKAISARSYSGDHLILTLEARNAADIDIVFNLDTRYMHNLVSTWAYNGKSNVAQSIEGEDMKNEEALRRKVNIMFESAKTLPAFMRQLSMLQTDPRFWF
ncbi:MAG: DNA cytosine methyltransferase [Bacteroidales bacterium]|nr:DNA cytosine methyltransferase [Bacteroidales bacterium]